MRKTLHLSLFLLVTCLIISCEKKAEITADRIAQRHELIDSTLISFEKKLLTAELDSVFAESKFNGSISVQQNGEVLYEKQQGFLNFKNKTEFTSNSVFAIASVSKQFTAVMVLLLEEEGKLKTTDSVSAYLDKFNSKPFTNITIENLLNHTSGLSDNGEGLLSKPSAEFHYSNNGYRYLGEIIEKASGKSYAENAALLFQKAGMKHSFTAKMAVDDNFASAFLGNEKQQSEVQNMPERLSAPEISSAAGGILSSTADLHLWQTALYNGKILSSKSLLKFLKNSAVRDHAILGKMGYGYGIMLRELSPKTYFHSGYVKGSPSLLIYYPETKTSVVILSNIAAEAKGKKSIFEPHVKVKRRLDAVVNAMIETRKALLN